MEAGEELGGVNEASGVAVVALGVSVDFGVLDFCDFDFLERGSTTSGTFSFAGVEGAEDTFGGFSRNNKPIEMKLSRV